MSERLYGIGSHFGSTVFGEGAGGNGGWTKILDLDFRTFTETDITGANTEAVVDGWEFETASSNSGTWTVGDATNGLVGTDSTSHISLMLGGGTAGTNSIDLSDDTKLLFFSAVVNELNPWVGQAGINASTDTEAFDPGWDVLRVNSLTYQAARRQSGTAFGTFNVALPPNPGGFRPIGMLISRAATSIAYGDVSVTEHTGLLAPDDPMWTWLDPGSVGAVGKTWNFATGGAENNFKVWLNGTTTYYVQGLQIWSLDLGARL